MYIWMTYAIFHKVSDFDMYTFVAVIALSICVDLLLLQCEYCPLNTVEPGYNDIG